MEATQAQLQALRIMGELVENLLNLIFEMDEFISTIRHEKTELEKELNRVRTP